MLDEKDIRTAITLKEDLENAQFNRVLGDFSDSETSESEDETADKEPAVKKQKINKSKRDFTQVEALLETFSTVTEKGAFAADDTLCATLKNDANETLFEGDLFHITKEQVITLYNKCPMSGFGNNKELKTEIDLDVRNARECTKFEFAKKINIEIPMFNTFTACEIVPYKINLYGPDGHFEKHKDTPERGMLGTMLVSLYHEDPGCDHLQLMTGKYGSYWYPKPRSWFAFFPDIVHSVSKRSFYRMTLACKVFAKDSVAPIPQNVKCEKMTSDLAAIMSLWKPGFGFILRHEYSITETHAWKSKDQALFEAIKLVVAKNNTLKYEFVPIVLHYSRTGDSDAEDEENQNDSLTVHCILAKHMSLSNIKLHRLYDCGFLWKQDKDEGAEHTGNESRPAHEDSLYVNMTLVVTER